MPDARIRSLLPLAHVADMAASIDFYGELGFAVANQMVPDGDDVPNWVLLESGRAALMLARASAPVVAESQAVLFYTYVDDAAASHAAFAAAGLAPGAIGRPFYNPGGEFRLEDPDGYVIYVAQI